jgi:hypothetical protein
VASCDVINLSLGGGPPDATTDAAIQDARTVGAVVIAAAGKMTVRLSRSPHEMLRTEGFSR